MQRKANTNKQERAAWNTPELRRLSAGSAEGAQGTIGDGGGPGASRS